MQRAIQVTVVLAVAIYAAVQLTPSLSHSESTSSTADKAKFDMLAYLDEKIASQECVKDVRCWSSVSKLQMFAAGAPIEHAALSARIECYNDLLNSIWKEAAKNSESEISENHLIEVLKSRFPGSGDGTWDRFEFLKTDEPDLVMNDLFTDYSDTIESWRIIQSWVARRTDQSGKVDIVPPFSPSALDEFQKFLIKFDIALLRHAKDVAEENKKSVIDAQSVRAAFASADTELN